MEQFVSDTGSDVVPHIPDPDGELWERFGVSEHRTYVLIDEDGTARTGAYGDLPDDVADLIAG